MRNTFTGYKRTITAAAILFCALATFTMHQAYWRLDSFLTVLADRISEQAESASEPGNLTDTSTVISIAQIESASSRPALCSSNNPTPDFDTAFSNISFSRQQPLLLGIICYGNKNTLFRNKFRDSIIDLQTIK